MYSCSHCDAQSLKWSGRCETCGSWGTVAEEAQTTPRARATKKGSSPTLPQQPLTTLTQTNTELERIPTGDTEVDRVLGGGLVRGSLVLLYGEPGVGKSTLVAQLTSDIASQGPVLYLSGEESASQLAARFGRLKKSVKNIVYTESGDVEALVETLEKEKPLCAVVDSIQTLSSSALETGTGSVPLIRYATSLLLEVAKRKNMPILLIGQVTKEGAAAGPKTLEHLVDVVLTLEGDPSHAFRLLRCGKNRFGATDEVGVFEMGGEGLQAVKNPSERFLQERQALAGSVITATSEGSRIFCVEVQALVSPSPFPTPVRRASGFDQNRLHLLLAILTKRAGLSLANKDVFVNVVGGLSLTEPAADAAVCAAILSSAKETTSVEPTAFIGEVGLGGELRNVSGLEKRILELARSGITRIVIPKTGALKKIPDGVTVVPVESVREL